MKLLRVVGARAWRSLGAPSIREFWDRRGRRGALQLTSGSRIRSFERVAPSMRLAAHAVALTAAALCNLASEQRGRCDHYPRRQVAGRVFFLFFEQKAAWMVASVPRLLDDSMPKDCCFSVADAPAPASPSTLKARPSGARGSIQGRARTLAGTSAAPKPPLSP